MPPPLGRKKFRQEGRKEVVAPPPPQKWPRYAYDQATNYISGDSKYDLIITVNITSMMVLASIYLSVSTSLPSTPNIKPVEIWLLFNLGYPFLNILVNIILQVKTNINA